MRTRNKWRQRQNKVENRRAAGREYRQRVEAEAERLIAAHKGKGARLSQPERVSYQRVFSTRNCVTLRAASSSHKRPVLVSRVD